MGKRSVRRPRGGRLGRKARSGGPEAPPLQPTRTPIPIPGDGDEPLDDSSTPPSLVSLPGGKRASRRLKEHDKPKMPAGPPSSIPPQNMPIPPSNTMPVVGIWRDEPAILFPFRRRLHIPDMESLQDREIRDRQEEFLHAIFQYGSIGRAATAVQRSEWLHRKWCEEYPEYKAAAEMAFDEHVQMLEMEADQRGLIGYQELVLYQGRPVLITGPDGKPQYLTKRVVSDTLLMFRLNGLRPERYRGYRVPVANANPKPAQAETDDEAIIGSDATAEGYDLTKYSDEELSNLRGLLSKGRAAGQQSA